MTVDDQLKSKIKQLEFMASSSRALNASLNFEQLVRTIMKIVKNGVNAEAASLALVDESGKHLIFEVARGRRDDRVRGMRIPVDEGVMGWVARKGKPLVLNDVRKDDRYSLVIEKKLGLRPLAVIAVPLFLRGKLLGVLEAVNPVRGKSFSPDDLELMLALGNHIATAVANARLFAQAQRRGLEYSLLAQVAADVGRSLALDEVLARILKNLKKLIQFDAAAIFLMDRSTKAMASMLHEGYRDGVDEKINLKCGEGIVGQVVQSRRGVIVGDVREDDHYVNARVRTRSEMVSPMISAGKVIGAFNLESDAIDAYTSEDLHLLEAFAGQAAASIERAHLFAEQHEKNEIQSELKVARTVQDFFSPKRTQTTGEYRIAGVNYPSLEVSGDYYDFFPVRGGMTAFAIADVAGKGVPASMIVSCFRGVLHTVAPYLTSARQIAIRANQILLETVRPQDFVTAFIGVIDPASGVITYCNSGHDRPILMKPDGTFRRLEVGGPVLGVMRDPVVQEGTLRLTDEVLVCYTDGATEASGPNGEEFGEDRLIEAIRKNVSESPHNLGRALHTSVKEFAGKGRQSDDMTFIVVRHK